MKISEFKLEDKSALEEFKGNNWPAADLEHYKDKQPDFSKSSHTLVATNDIGKIIGYIIFTIDTGITWVESMIVDSKARGQGIGSELITHAENLAKSKGSHKIWLETGLDWKAKSLYEKLGFTVRATLPNHYGHQDFVLMDKELLP